MKNLLRFKDNFFRINFSPLKRLRKGISFPGGRNNMGRITSYHRGGKGRRLFRNLEYRYHLWGLYGEVLWMDKDPNRSGWVATVEYGNKIVTSLLAADKLSISSVVANGFSKEGVKFGFGNRLKEMAMGAKIFNVERYPLQGGQIARAAGMFVTIIRKSTQNLVLLRNRKKRFLFSFNECAGTYGMVSNTEHQLRKIQKAGRARNQGRRPIVRGVAMNPIDHPHGGGEGKTSGGRHPTTPWGKLTKGKKTLTLKKKKQFRIFYKRAFK